MHNILGQRFISRERPAWHNVGILFGGDDEVLPTEAVKRVAGDIKVVERELGYYDPHPNLEGEWERIPGKKAIVRLPTKEDFKPHLFGIANDGWRAASYVDLASVLDRLFDKDIFKVETAGCIENGGLVFLALRGEDWSVLGDEMKSYIVFNLSLIVGRGHTALHTNIRVVCENTNMAALGSSKIKLSVPHSADAAQQIGIVGDLVLRYRESQDETKRIFETWARTKAPVENVKTVVDSAFPDPKKPRLLEMIEGASGGEEGRRFFQAQLTDAKALEKLEKMEERWNKDRDRAKACRSAALERFDAFEPYHLQGTLWAAYNACTEVSDWREGRGDVDASTLFGERAKEKERAFTAAYSLIQ